MNRRDILGASALAMTTALMGVNPAEAATPQLSVADKTKLLQTYARIRGGIGDGLAMWWYTGTVWGKPVNDIARPVFGVQGLTFNRVAFKPDGSVEQKMAGRGWYSDLATGQPLETWTHPTTGEKITPPHIKSVQTQSIAVDGTLATREMAALDALNGAIGGLTINGDTVWLTENVVAKYKPDDARGGLVNTTSSVSTFTAKIKDVENASADFVPAYLNYQSMASWPAWMKITNNPGTVTWQTHGQKVRGVDAGPADLRAWIDARHPGFLKDPGI